MHLNKVQAKTLRSIIEGGGTLRASRSMVFTPFAYSTRTGDVVPEKHVGELSAGGLLRGKIASDLEINFTVTDGGKSALLDYEEKERALAKAKRDAKKGVRAA